MDRVNITPVRDGWFIVETWVDRAELWEATDRPTTILSEALDLIEEARRDIWAEESLAQRRHEVTCERCGSAFIATHPSATYCSSRCRVAAHRARHRAG